MTEFESQPTPESYKQLSDTELIQTIQEALRLFDSPDEAEHQRLDTEILPLLSNQEQIRTDLILSTNTRGFLEDKLDQLQAKSQHNGEQGV